ncbi:MAG: hypothetical protein JWQ09_1828 [Segetibacter sp.]|nr:hypothetical protein [Segetibacter sp.]
MTDTKTKKFGYITFFIPFIAASLVGVFVSFLLEKAVTPVSDKRGNLYTQIDSLKTVLNKYLLNSSPYNKDSVHARVSDTSIIRDVTLLRNRAENMQTDITALNNLLRDSPGRYVEIANISKDLSDLKSQYGHDFESMKREVDRISSYNNTLIVFMITFLVAYLAIGVINFVQANKKPSSAEE